MTFETIKDKVGRYYTGRLLEHGASARGVDWNSEESQHLRFMQLTRIAPDAGPFSVVDYGCGYGALVSYLEGRGYDFDYQGFDISSEMIERARRDHVRGRFTSNEGELEPADYTLASGIFNVRLDTSVEDWTDYVLETITTLDRFGSKGFAFNMLTSYSDADRMRTDLYYGDPLRFFDHCKRTYSKQVALLHDYGLYEFTIMVRK